MRRFSRGCLWTLLIASPVALLTLIFLFLRQVHRFSQYGPVAKTLPAELAAAKEMGLPLTPTDLRPNPPIPGSQNAASIYVQIDRKIRSLPKAVQDEENKVLDFARRPNSPRDIAKARSILVNRAPELMLAEKASRLPHCDFHRPWEQGPNVMFPELATARQLARLLSARALIASRSGHVRDALRDLSTGAKIGQHMGEDPCVIALLVEIALKSIVDRTFREIVIAHRSEPGLLQAALQVSLAFESPPDLERSFRGEIIMGRVCVEIIRTQHIATPLKGLDQFMHIRQDAKEDMCRAWDARMINYWRHAMAALRSNRGNILRQHQALNSLDQQVDELRSRPTYELLDIVFPVFGQVELKAMTSVAQDRLRRALIDLLSYRNRTGSYPDSLAELASRGLPDIFSEKAPIYRKTANGFILYSLGPNLRDDGGKPKADKKGDPPPDIVVQDPVQ